MLHFNDSTLHRSRNIISLFCFVFFQIYDQLFHRKVHLSFTVIHTKHSVSPIIK